MNASKTEFLFATARPSTRSVRSMMVWVLIALLPGIAGRVAVFGFGVFWRIAFALAFALLVEAFLLQLRRHSLRHFLADGSAAVAAVLLALCLPPISPWWIVACAVLAALVFGKHAYGGIGRNPFNPAMLGVALVLLCFPGALATIPTANAAHGDHAWMWIAGFDALGGVVLLSLRIVRWQTPLAVLAGAAICAAILDFTGNAVAHRLFADNLVLAAFIIASDPVTGCTTPRGRWLFGFGIGLLLVMLQRHGATSSSLPFAVLLMNCAAPWIDARLQQLRLAKHRHE